MSRFLATLCDAAARSPHGMTTGAADPQHRTWAQVHATAARMAAALQAGQDGPDDQGGEGGAVGGLRRGDAVGVLAADPTAIAPAVQAVWLSGASATMLHQPTARTDLAAWAEETVTVLRMIDARFVLLGAPFDGLAPVLAQRGVAFRLLDDLDRNPAAPGITVDAAVAGEDDVALLQLTSGSTAEPKAVRITHRNLHTNIAAMAQAAQLDPADDVMVSWLPLFHDMGMVGFLTIPMVLGIRLVKVTPADFLGRPVRWAELISEYGGTVTAAPNFAYAVLARQLARVDDGELDLSRLRIALNGAEPVDPDAVAAFTTAGARFGLRAEAVLAAYGMAETGLGVAFAPVLRGLEIDEVDAEQLESHRRAVPAGDGPSRRFPLLGAPLPGLEIRSVDDAGAVLAERGVGVLQLRGEAVSPGYLTVNGPLATQDADGWFDTGDEGYLIDGQVVVCGRRKDLIIMGGRNIYPTDIERAAAGADDVRAGNTVAVRLAAGQGRHRESFAVAVESRRAGDAGAEKVIAKDVTSRVFSAVGVRPAEVVVLAPGTLPKTPSGKLRRAATADLLDTRS